MSTIFQTISDEVKVYNGSVLTECLLSEGFNISPKDNALLPASTSIIHLQWEPILGAEWYVVQYSLNSDFRGATTRGFKVFTPNNAPNSCPVSGVDEPPSSVYFDVPNDIKRGFTYYWRVFPYSRCNGACAGPPTDTFSFKIALTNIDLDCENDVTIGALEVPSRRVLKDAEFVVSTQWSAPSYLNVVGEWIVEGANSSNSTTNSVQVRANEEGTIKVKFCLKELTSSGSSEVCCKEIEIEVQEREIIDSSSPPPTSGNVSSALVSSATSSSFGSSNIISSNIGSSDIVSSILSSSVPISSFVLSSDFNSSLLPSSGSATPSSNPCPDFYTGVLRVAIVTGVVNDCYTIKPMDLTFDCGHLVDVADTPSSG